MTVARLPREEFLAQYQHPDWQKKRLEILNRDAFTCTKCNDTTTMLDVHHRYYDEGKEPWDYPDTAFTTLCRPCHEEETARARETRGWLSKELARCGFMAEEVVDLARTFSRAKLMVSPKMLAFAVEYLVCNPAVQMQILRLMAEREVSPMNFVYKHEATWFEAHGHTLEQSILREDAEHREDWLRYLHLVTSMKYRAEAKREALRLQGELFSAEVEE